MNKIDFKNILLSRVPLHLLSVKDGNLIPLRNGLNNYAEFDQYIRENQASTETCVNYIQLGIYEKLIKEAKNIKVFSIIGR